MDRHRHIAVLVFILLMVFTSAIQGAQIKYGSTPDGKVIGECIRHAKPLAWVLEVRITNLSDEDLDLSNAHFWCFDSKRNEITVLAPGELSNMWKASESQGDYYHEFFEGLTSDSFGPQKPILPGTTARILYVVNWPTPEEVVLEIPGHGKLWIKIQERETAQD